MPDGIGWEQWADLETWKALLSHYGYGLIFLGVMLENTGLPLPGETITLTGGFLAGNRELEYWSVLGSAILGAILGDNLGYWLGAWGGWPLLVRIGRIFKIDESGLRQARRQFRRNAGKAVLLGRFVTLLRILAGPLAGISRMPYSRFLLFNALGATAWATTMVSLAYLLGQFVPLEQLVTHIGQVALGGLALVLLWLGGSRWWHLRGRNSIPDSSS